MAPHQAARPQPSARIGRCPADERRPAIRAEDRLPRTQDSRFRTYVLDGRDLLREVSGLTPSLRAVSGSPHLRGRSGPDSTRTKGTGSPSWPGTAAPWARDGHRTGCDRHHDPHPAYGTDVLTTVESCIPLHCKHRGIALFITGPAILPRAYLAVYSPSGRYFAFVRNVRGVPEICLTVNDPAHAGPDAKLLAVGTEPDWQPVPPYPPAWRRP